MSRRSHRVAVHDVCLHGHLGVVDDPEQARQDVGHEQVLVERHPVALQMSATRRRKE